MSRPLVAFLMVLWLVSSSIPVFAPVGSEGAAAAAPKYQDESYGRFEWLNPFPTGNDLNGVAWSPDGKTALMVGSSGTLVTFNGVKFSTVFTNTDLTFTDVAWYPTGDYALLTAQGGKLLKYENGILSDIPTGTNVNLNSISINPNTGLGAIVGDEKTILLVDGDTVSTISSGGNIGLNSVSWEPGGNYAITVGRTAGNFNQQGVILIYWLENNTVKTIANLPAIAVTDVSFSPNSEEAVITANNISSPQGYMYFWNESGLKRSFVLSDYNIRGASWSPDGVHAYTSSIRTLYEMTFTPDTMKNYTFSTQYSVFTLAISWKPDGSTALIVGERGITLNFDGNFVTNLQYYSPSRTMNAVAWSPDGSKCVAVGVAGQVAVFDGSKTTTTNVRVRQNIRTLNGVAWNPDGSYALIVGDAGSIVKYNSGGTFDTALQSGTVQNLRAVAWAPDGSYALIVGDSGTVRKFSGSVSTAVPSVTQYTLRGVAFRPSDNMAFIVGGDVRSVQGPTGAVRTSWQVVLQYNGRIITTSRVIQQGPVFNSISFSPAVIAADGGNIVLIEDTGVYKHYNLTVASNLLGGTWLGPKQDALMVGEGGTVALFNLSRQQPRQIQSSTIQPFTAAAMRPQGDYALCVGFNGMMMKYFPNAPPDAVTLNAPQNVTDNALELSWSVNQDKDFSHYELYQSSLQNFSTFKYILNSSDQGSSGLLVTGLTKQTTYYYKMRVFDNAGLNADSNVVKATTLLGNIAPVAAVLSDPLSITNSSMTLMWSKNGDGDFARYELHKGASKGFTISANTLLASISDQGTTEYPVTDLASSTNYYFKVRTYDSAGLYNDSNEVNATTEAINIPPAASVLEDPSDLSDTSMKLTWTGNDDSDFGRYELYIGNASGFELGADTLLQSIANRSTTSYTVTGLADNTTYFFRLRVYDSSGLYNDSNEVAGTTLPPNAPPSPVTLLPPTDIGETTVTLEWTRNLEADFAQYEVAGSTQQGFEITAQSTFTTLVESNQTSYTVTALVSNTTYYFKVRVRDVKDLFADSNEVSAVTIANFPPAAVALYGPVDETEGSMVMEWAQSTDADFDRYELHRSLDTGFEPSPSTLVAQISDRAGVVYNVTGLAPNTTYFFKVRVYDTGQLSNDSNEMNGTTLGPNMPPAAPTLADPEQITETTVFLEWTANTEADFAQYAVHRSTAKAFAPTTATFVANVTGIRATSYNVTQLKPGTTYYFKIEVQDQAGKSNLSNEVSARTLTVNIPPTCDAGGDRTVTVNSIVEFRATASDPDGQIVSYQWDFNSDGDWDTNSTTGTATYVYSQVGSYSARLRVQDDRDAFAESVANMTVIPAVPPNLLPLIHDVGEDGISAYIGDEVFFAANASDPDGFITKYQWDFKGDGLYEYGSDTDANTTYTYDTAGNFTAVLRVTDNRDGVSFGYRNVSVTRLDHAPIPKIDAPREDQKFYVDDLITLNGQSSEDPDGDPMTFLWENDRTNTKLGTSALVKLTMDKGNYTIRLTVSDGELSTIALVNISVADRPNVIPTIKIESPLNNAVVKGLLTLTGSARDNTKVVRVEVRVDPTGSWKTATGTKSWSFEIDTKPLAAGQHTVYARAYDGTDYSTEASIKLTFQNEVAKTPETKGFIPGFETGALALTLLLAGAWLNMARKGKGTD